MSQRLLTVNFGAGKASLSTIGYTLYNSDGTVYAARSTTGVVEIGTATGIYAAPIALAEGFTGVVLFDTGDVSVRYGQAESSAQLNAIQEGTDYIRIIWNSLKNQGLLYERLLNRLDALNGTPVVKEYGRLLTELKTLIKTLPIPTLAEIRHALTVKVDAPPAPIVNIPKTVIPDYTVELGKIRNRVEGLMIPDHSQALAAILQTVNAGLSGLREDIRQIPKTQKDYTEALRLLSDQLRTAERMLQHRVESAAKPADVSKSQAALLAAVQRVEQTLTEAMHSTDGIDRLLDRLESIKKGKANQDILAMLGYS